VLEKVEQIARAWQDVACHGNVDREGFKAKLSTRVLPRIVMIEPY
jgi:hypothetical protein